MPRYGAFSVLDTDSQKGDALQTTIHVVRHGEVDNPDAILYGRQPGFGLTPLGKRMAQRVADVLVESDHQITGVVASPLLRAQKPPPPPRVPTICRLNPISGLLKRGIFRGRGCEQESGDACSPEVEALLQPVQTILSEPYTDLVSRMTLARCASQVRRAEKSTVSPAAHLTLRSFAERRPLWHDPRKRNARWLP